MEGRSMNVQARFLQCLWLLVLWPHLLVTGRYNLTDENVTLSYRPQDLEKTGHPNVTVSRTSQDPEETVHHHVTGSHRGKDPGGTTPQNVTQLPSEVHTWSTRDWEQDDVSLSDQNMTDTPFPLPPMTQSSPCQNIEETMRAGEGVIEFKETSSHCTELWTWDIQVNSPSDGIILQFNDVYAGFFGVMRIFTLARGSERVELRKFTHKKSDSMFFAPLLLQAPRVIIELTTPDTFYEQTIVVNISYFAHPISKMPPVMFNSAVPGTSLFTYDCSGNVTIPKAFRCDMVQQCAMNEDEEGCPYMELGCEIGWLPHRHHCLKMDFVVDFGYVPGHPHPTFPSEAEKRCSSKYGASLATLPDDEGMNLVGRLLRQSDHNDVVVGIRKVKPVSKKMRHLYRFLWQWGDKGSPIAYEQQQLQRDGPLLDCATLNAYPTIHLQPLRCVLPNRFPKGYVCMKPNPALPEVSVPPPVSVHFPAPSRPLTRIPTKQCSDGSLVQTFQRCQSDDLNQWSPNGFALYHCLYGPPVHYALVCDGNSDCADGSDEMDCGTVTDYQTVKYVFICQQFQIIAQSQRCNGIPDCFDESDEEDCTLCKGITIMCTGVGCVPGLYASYINSCPTIALSRERELVLFHPSAVTFNGYGMSRMTAPEEYNMEGMFECVSGDFIPSFLLNNGELDCSFGEDENIPSGNVTCPGFYICQYSGQCVHPDFICDGIYHCPYKDDERYCILPCPQDCICEGYAYFCSGLSEPLSLWHAHYLDLSGSVNVSLHSLQSMLSLQFLNLSRCRLYNAGLKNMTQLKILDLSFNNLTSLSSLIFERLIGLSTLNVSSNPFVKILDSSFITFIKSSGLNSLNSLTISDTDLQSVQNGAFSALAELLTLDIQRNQIKFYGKEIFSGLDSLETLLTDDSKLCCRYFHTALTECIAPVDELSSCSDMLREDFFRVFLWTFSVLAITGNVGVLLYRALAKQKSSPPAFHVLVSNLCVADFFMGVYMMIIGVADANFHGIYVTKETEWKSSWACKIAGFLGLVSSEVSAMVICLITLDRLLVLYFPFNFQLHLKGRSSMVVCAIVWCLGLSIAAVPFLLGLEFYGETSICLPLPITRHKFSGQHYAFGVFIILNFVLFIVIGMGQIFIYCTVRSAGTLAGARRRSQELAIARRLFLVVFTDFCCWFPIGLMGLLASQEVSIPGEVNVWAAIFILPLNSALNPFLYTLNAVLEKRRAAQLQQRTRKILGNMQSALPKLEPSLAQEVVRVCIRSQVVSREQMSRWLNLRQEGHCESEVTTEITGSFFMDDTKMSVTNFTDAE